MQKKRDDNNYSHILKYTGIFGGVQGLNMLIGLVRNKIVAYLLGPAGMGLTALFNSAVAFISQATNLGISFSAVRHVSELYDGGDAERVAYFVKVVRSWSLLTALLGMLVCIAAGPLLSSFTFSWGNHTLHFVLLAPAVALMAITGGEMAILKGCRQLKSLALIQVFNVFLALLISLPVYYFFGQAGIVPVIVAMALTAMLLTVRFSYKLFPLSLVRTKGVLGEGMEMVRLGVAFVLAGILGSGAEIVIRSFLNVDSNLDVVGLYNAGLMITVTYAGMVFSAMETDYFPRLSAAGDDRRAICDMVNKQIEVSVLLVSPLLSLLIVFMPVIIPLLFTRAFMPVVAMAQVTALSMYLKAVSLPMAYLLLARGDSKGYLLVEALGDVLMVVFVIVGFRMWGLWGTGLGLTMAYLVDLLIVYFYVSLRYRYQPSLPMLFLASVQLLLGVGVYFSTLLPSALLTWVVGGLLSACSMTFSLFVLHRKTQLWKALKHRFNLKFRRRHES